MANAPETGDEGQDGDKGEGSLVVPLLDSLPLGLRCLGQFANLGLGALGGGGAFSSLLGRDVPVAKTALRRLPARHAGLCEKSLLVVNRPSKYDTGQREFLFPVVGRVKGVPEGCSWSSLMPGGFWVGAREGGGLLTGKAALSTKCQAKLQVQKNMSNTKEEKNRGVNEWIEWATRRCVLWTGAEPEVGGA